MDYSKCLKNMLKNSDLTLKEIAKECTNYGVNVNASYLSKLQLGRQSPASDKVNIAIAKACKSDPTQLLITAYLSKAPDFVINNLINLVKYSKTITKLYLSTNPSIEVKTKIEQWYTEFTNDEFIKAISDKEEVIQDELEINNYNHVIHSELLNIEGFSDYLIDPFFMEDDSMHPIIPKGVMLHTKTTSAKNGDIVSALVNKNHYVRFYLKYRNNIFLIPCNNKYQVLIEDVNSVKIVGRVISYKQPLP